VLLKDIIQKVADTLKDSAELKYVDQANVFIGGRAGDTSYPAIYIEPLKEEENDETYPRQLIHADILIMMILRCQDKDLQIIGNDTVRGVVDALNDMKKALSADRTLCGYAKRTWVVESEFGVLDEYPTRSITVTFRVEYEQNYLTRA